MVRTVPSGMLVLITFSVPFLGAGAASRAAFQAETLDARVGELESETGRLRSEIKQQDGEIQQLGSRVKEANRIGFPIFLFGAFCALWAQNTGRSAWGWFFLGALFNVITVVVLLAKNSSDKRPAL